MATARISKGDNAPDGDLTITPAAGEQFSVADGATYETSDDAQIAALAGSFEGGLLKVEYVEDESYGSQPDEDDKARRAAARKRAREIEKAAERGQFVPGQELTSVEGASQSDPNAGAARDNQESGN